MAKLTGAGAMLAGGCLLWAVSQGVQADTNLIIRATIIAPPPCVINGGGTLDVPFGNDLQTSRVDGVNYRRNVPYTVNQLRSVMSVAGTPVSHRLMSSDSGVLCSVACGASTLMGLGATA